MAKTMVQSSFKSPVTGGVRPEKEFRCVRRFRIEAKIKRIDKAIARALRRGDLDSVADFAYRRNHLLNQI